MAKPAPVITIEPPRLKYHKIALLFSLTEVAKARPGIEKACAALWKTGRAVHHRDVRKLLPANILAPVSRLRDALKDVQVGLLATGSIAEHHEVAP